MPTCHMVWPHYLGPKQLLRKTISADAQLQLRASESELLETRSENGSSMLPTTCSI